VTWRDGGGHRAGNEQAEGALDGQGEQAGRSATDVFTVERRSQAPVDLAVGRMVAALGLDSGPEQLEPERVSGLMPDLQRSGADPIGEF
jgi:hypothetical protein